LASARVVQRYLLERLPDPGLRVYVVWGPMLGGETEAAARAATGLVPDPRATHYWTAAHTLAERLRGPAGLVEELAWDTFLLFPPEARWGEVPPTPSHVMHVDKRLPADRRLNGETLAAEARKLLSPDGVHR
jgi:hypothetical protein